MSPQDDLCHLCHRVTQVPSGLALPSPEIAMTLKKPHKADSMLYGMIILPQVSPGSKCWGWEPRAPPQPRWLPSGASLFPLLSQYDAQREGRALEVHDHRAIPAYASPAHGVPSTCCLPEGFLTCSWHFLLFPVPQTAASHFMFHSCHFRDILADRGVKHFLGLVILSQKCTRDFLLRFC